MRKSHSETKSGINFTAVDLGPLCELDNYHFKHPSLPKEIKGKVFLRQLLGLTSSEISFNKMPPRGSMPFYHKHRMNEEVYVFIKGCGEFQIDHEMFPVKEGTVIRVAPGGARCWRNNSEDDLYYIVFQARAGSCEDHTILDGFRIEETPSWVNK